VFRLRIEAAKNSKVRHHASSPLSRIRAGKEAGPIRSRALMMACGSEDSSIGGGRKIYPIKDVMGAL
jgi:hypothetical protein